jgi:hypothetical protein
MRMYTMWIPRTALVTFLAIALLSSSAGPAYATLQTFAFEATVDEDSFETYDGPALPDLFGEVATVTVSYQDSKLVGGTGEISPPFLTVDVLFLGQSFNEQDDEGYPSYPILEIEDHELLVMDVFLEDLEYDDPRIRTIVVGFSGQTFNGDLRTFIDIETVPEPTAYLLGLV